MMRLDEVEHRLMGMEYGFLTRGLKLFEHEVAESCMCEPECVYIDPESGNEVWVHRDIGSV